MLLHLLKDLENLFDGTLARWNTEPEDIEINPDATPSSSRYYPTPNINKETFRKELARLVKISVSTSVQQSEYDTPVFIISKKEVTVRLLTKSRQVNNTIVQKYYPIPIIDDTMKKLEGFQFATLLDLNMG